MTSLKFSHLEPHCGYNIIYTYGEGNWGNFYFYKQDRCIASIRGYFPRDTPMFLTELSESLFDPDLLEID